MPFLAGQIVTAAALNLATRRIVARANRTITTANITGTEVGVLRWDDIPLEGGRIYQIDAMSVGVNSGGGTDGMALRMRATGDGSTPTISSTEIGVWRLHPIPNSNNDPFISFSSLYIPGSADVTFSLLLTAQRLGTTDTMTVSAATGGIHLLAWDMGEDPGDIGTDL